MGRCIPHRFLCALLWLWLEPCVNLGVQMIGQIVHLRQLEVVHQC